MEQALAKRLAAALAAVMAQKDAVNTVGYRDENGFYRARYFSPEPDGAPLLAVYNGERDREDADRRLENPGYHGEPSFLLQNCLMLSLGGKGKREARGQVYRVGFLPVRWKRSDMEWVLPVLEGFAAVLAGSAEPADIPVLPPKTYMPPPDWNPVRAATVRGLNRCDRVYVMDTAFTCRAFNFGSELHPNRCIPVTVVGVCDGQVVRAEFVRPRKTLLQTAFIVLGDFLLMYGRPRELVVCREELYATLADFCRAAEIPLRKTESLPELDAIYDRINH